MLFLKIKDYETNNESNNNLEIMEESFVASGNKVSIHVTPDINRNIGTDPMSSIAYFKVGNNKSFKKSTKIVRISFYRAEYIDHYKKSGITRLTSAEKKDLIKLLNSKQDGEKVWDILIKEYNRVFISFGVQIPIELPMPDYSELEVEK